MERLGKQISAGSVKWCAELPGRRVALVGESYGRLAQEQRHLRTLRDKYGLPVLETKLKRFLDEDDQPTWALEAERYDFHVLGRDEPTVWACMPDLDGYCALGTSFLKLLPGHIASLRRIAVQLYQQAVHVEDLQFLCRGKSEVVICDPYGIKRNNYRSFREVRRMIRAHALWKEMRASRRDVSVVQSEAA